MISTIHQESSSNVTSNGHQLTTYGGDSVNPFLFEDRVGKPSLAVQYAALKLLDEAYKFANDCGERPWDFAIEISEFCDNGVSRSTVRWLVAKHLMEHRIEAITNHQHRQFSEAPNHYFNDRSCFVLSSRGHEVFYEIERIMQNKSQSQSAMIANRPTMNSPSPEFKPHWCPQTRILSIDGKIVKHFKWPAPNQEKLIAAFAEEDWPSHIDDPLPPNDVCPKRRLHDTIKCLNRNQANKLIKFRGDGTGQGALWEYRPPVEESDKREEPPAGDEPINTP